MRLSNSVQKNAPDNLQTYTQKLTSPNFGQTYLRSDQLSVYLVVSETSL